MKNRKIRSCRRGGALLALLLLTAVLITGCGTGISDPTKPGTKSNTQPETKEGTTSDMTQDTTKKEETTAVPQNQTEAKQKGYVVVTDTVKADGSTDVTKALQELIDANPNRTLFFPDGTYLISLPAENPRRPDVCGVASAFGFCRNQGKSQVVFGQCHDLPRRKVAC